MPSIKNTTALVLAGGLGTRLRTVVEDRPKVLAVVGKRPFVTYLLDELQEAGIRHVVLSVGYLGSLVRRAVGVSYQGMRIDYAHETEPLGTAGALRFALPQLASDPVLVLNGDSIHRFPLKALFEAHAVERANATVVVTRRVDVSAYGRVELSGQQIVSFKEKVGSLTSTNPSAQSTQQTPGEWVNAGIYLINQCVLQAIPVSRVVSLEREVLPDWVGRGLCAYRSEGMFLDIGTPESYARAPAFVANRSPEWVQEEGAL